MDIFKSTPAKDAIERDWTIETLTVEKDGSQISGDDDDTVEPLGYWMEDHKAELDSRDH